jgi:hypothetical protein
MALMSNEEYFQTMKSQWIETWQTSQGFIKVWQGPSCTFMTEGASLIDAGHIEPLRLKPVSIPSEATLWASHAA